MKNCGFWVAISVLTGNNDTRTANPFKSLCERYSRILIMMKRSIAVVINVYREPSIQLRECFSRVAAHLHPSAVTIVVNGIQRNDIESLAAQFGLQVQIGENLGTNATWHLWWLKMLHIFDRSGAEICFKFDPDTMVDADPQNIPDAHYFGTATDMNQWGTVFVQGGVTGLSRYAVTKLLEERLLEPGNSKRWMEPVPSNQTFIDDKLIAEALAEINISASNWEECKSMWRTPVANNPIAHAIVHPRYYFKNRAIFGNTFLPAKAEAH